MSDERVLQPSPDHEFLARIAALSPAKRALLERRLKQQGVMQAEEKTIPRRSNHEAPPLSFAQQRLWFLDQLEPENAIYNIPRTVRLSGLLCLPALEQSLNEVVRRHESLRTTFTIRNGGPVQTIVPALTFTLPVVDITDRAEDQREAEAQRLVNEEACLPFDLTHGPLLRAKVFRLGAQEHIFVLTFHHIVFDGWSLRVLYRELSTLYQAFSQGLPSPLSDLSLQYADYAVWQRDWLQGEVLNSQLSYWKRQLADLPAILNLPLDHPRPARQTFRGALQSLLLPQSLATDLKKISRQGGVTLNMTMLAAFQTLLYRYTSQDLIVVGSPIAGRRHKETEEMIGFFVNTLALKTDLSGNPMFVELLTRVRRVTLEAYYYQDLPFEKVVEELQPERNLSHSPLFRVMCAFQNVPQEALALTGLTVTSLEVDGENAKFDLTLVLAEHEGTLQAALEYNTDLFEQPTIVRMLAHYQTLLHGIVENPYDRLSELPILTATEQHQLQVGWNTTKRVYPHEQCVHHLFEAQVKQTPKATAIIFENQRITYSELNVRANQLAHYLRSLGVGPDVLVALCMDRSLDMIVGLLGILKAGGAYVPLDPSYPKERLQFMLTDTNAPVLLTQQHLCESLPPHNARVFCLDRDWAVIRQESPENLLGHSTAENLAYVIYTSGSTGRPKGVEIPHRGVVRLVCGSEYAHFDSREVFLQLAPISFDAATFEIWGALLHGAQCVLFPGRIPTPPDLSNILRKHRVSTLWLTASLFNNLIDQAPEVLVGVRQLLIGGEALSIAHVRRALTLLPDTQLINGYGPTESTTFTCTYAIPRHVEETATSIPIGKPIANTEVYILDAHLSLVPIGVTGELYIGGDGLARGYLNRPELTAATFIPNPFLPGTKLYKTGDLVRYLPDGTIEFLGRSDHQVKMRGFRIELGEIETVLNTHPAVQATVIVVRENPPSDKCLVAYIVATSSSPPSVQELRSFMKQKVPEYMIPSAFVMLEAFPLTPNGKVNRQALPVPELSRTEPPGGFVAPRTPFEQRLAAIWSEALKVDQIGVHDNFFDLGGHSLLATQVTLSLQKQLGRTVPVASLFHAPTIEQFARLLRTDEPVASDEIDKRMISLWETEFNTGPLTTDSNFFDLGGNWRHALHLLLQVEMEFGTRLPLSTLFERPTLGQMVNRLRQQDKNDQAPLLLPYRTTGSQPPFFALSVSRDLIHYLRPDIPLYAFPPYGFDGERRPGTVEEIATQYLREIRTIQAEGPYWLGGYSLEGMIAFEMAQQLQRQGQTVAGLFLIDPTPPYSGSISQPVHSPHLPDRHISQRIGSSLSHYVTHLQSLPLREQVIRLRNGVHWRLKKKLGSFTTTYKLFLCRGYLAVGRIIPPELREFYGNHSRYPIARRYRPKPYAGRVILFKSTERKISVPEDWEYLLTGAVDTHYISARHGAIYQAPYFHAWAPQLANAIHQCYARGATALQVIDKAASR